MPPAWSYTRLKKLPEVVKLNVKGQIIESELSTLKKIKGSILDDVFSGRILTAVDAQNQPCIDSNPQAFADMIEFLKQHRAWLPSKKGSKVRRDLAETEIRRWKVDKGLASPSVLTTQIAQNLQKIYNSMPDLSECENQQNVTRWMELGPVKLSWIAQYATQPIDLDDDRHILMVRDEDGTKCWTVENKNDNLISSFENSSLFRSIDRAGNICEG